MAWHLHTVKQRLILATLIRRHVYTSAVFCCVARSGCIPFYHCYLHHKYQTTTFLFHPTANQLHTTHCKSQGIPRPSKPLHSHWPWEYHCTSKQNKSHEGGTDVHEKHKNRHKSKESLSKVCNEEFHTLEEFQHSRRSQSLHWDRRETRLMCINHKCGFYVRNDVCDTDTQVQGSSPKTDEEHCESSQEQCEISKEMNLPLVFLLDSKGRQEMLDLLEEHKQSPDHNAFNALNRLVDIIQKESLSKHHNSKPFPDLDRDASANYTKTWQNCLKEVCDTTLTRDSSDQDYIKTAKSPLFYKQKSAKTTSAASFSTHNKLLVQYASAANEHVNLSSGKDAPVREPDKGGAGQPSKEQLAIMYHRLYEQIPNFYSQSHDYSMYSDNIVFDNRILNVKTKGLPAYKATVQSLKYLSTACLWNVNLEVLNLTINTEMSCIHARWRVTGVPLHRLILFPWRSSAKKYFDAFSTFDVGSDGLIHTHTVDKVMPTPGDKVTSPSLVTRLGLALGIIRPPAPAVQGNCTGNVNLSFMKLKWLFRSN